MTHDEEFCPVSVTLSVLAGKWKPIILWRLKDKPVRFNELRKSIPGITQKMLTAQLRELESDGIIARKVYPEVPPRVEYSITKYGESLHPVLAAMAKWGVEHRARVEKNALKRTA